MPVSIDMDQFVVLTARTYAHTHFTGKKIKDLRE